MNQIFHHDYKVLHGCRKCSRFKVNFNSNRTSFIQTFTTKKAWLKNHQCEWLTSNLCGFLQLHFENFVVHVSKNQLLVIDSCVGFNLFLFHWHPLALINLFRGSNFLSVCPLTLVLWNLLSYKTDKVANFEVSRCLR